MPTSNELFRDAMVRHQIGLQRVQGSIRNDILALLDATEKDLSALIRKRLKSVVPGKGVEFSLATTKRLQILQKAISTLRRTATSNMLKLWNKEMAELLKSEIKFVASAMSAVTPTALSLALPEITTLLSLVTQSPFEGKVMRQWASNIHSKDLNRIMDQIKIGMVQGDSSAAIARRVVGTARLNGTNGVTEITRRHAASITRTAVNHFSNKAKEALYLANSDIIKKEVYVATLDGVTTAICSSLDGREFKVGEGPRPPLHFNCRSTRIGIIDSRVAGERPIKPVTERGLVREFAQKNKLGRITSRSRLPFGTKGTFDKFARVRTRELIGRVPVTQTYQQFLKNQPVQFQNDVLGVTKAKLFRKGGLTLDRYVDVKGNELTLRQLAVLEKDAFIKAGLDPKDFLS